jgi:aldose 1-epimerase
MFWLHCHSLPMKYPSRKTAWIAVGLFAAVVALAAAPEPAGIAREPFGSLPDGTPVEIFTLRNAQGATARICTYGGILTSLVVPDRTGTLGDVVLGYDRLEDYVRNNPYFGALIGRYANRIALGRFTLEGHAYQVPPLYGPHSLHGGLKGFDKVNWTVIGTRIAGPDVSLELGYLSRDGEEGFPGNLRVTATYILTGDNTLRLDLTATTDAVTLCNLTNHSYFNLAGRGDVLNHVVALNADRFTPGDPTAIPTGEMRAVRGTPFDFTRPAVIGARINEPDEQLRIGRGYDHNFVLNGWAPGRLVHAATVTEPGSGRVMEVWTTAPGVQFYTGNHLNSLPGKGGWKYESRHGFCLEPGAFPDTPNHPDFPSAVLHPGETYRSTILYKFSVQ